MTGEYAPFSADGLEVGWSTWDGEGDERTTIRWENEGWTVTGDVSRQRIQYVVRASSMWRVRQFMLFRDLDEPDLWLARDAEGRWGEIGGTYRCELDGCEDVELSVTPFTLSLPILRLGLGIGSSADVDVVVVDTETLGTRAARRRVARLGEHRWRVDQLDTRTSVELDVDDHGLVTDVPAHFRRERSSG